MTIRVLHSFFASLSDPQPPSVNHLYTTFRGRRILTKEGRAFKDALTEAVSNECAVQPWFKAIEAVYREAAWIRLTMGVHMSLYNESWKPGGRTKKGELQSPYKKKDGSSYIKAIEDAVADGTGIDDSANMDTRIIKIDGPVPLVEVYYEILSTMRSMPRGV